jgi:hypothetical protein
MHDIGERNASPGIKFSQSGQKPCFFLFHEDPNLIDGFDGVPPWRKTSQFFRNVTPIPLNDLGFHVSPPQKPPLR